VIGLLVLITAVRAWAEKKILSYTLLSSKQIANLTVWSLNLGTTAWFVNGICLSSLNGASQLANTWNAAVALANGSPYRYWYVVSWLMYSFAPVAMLVVIAPPGDQPLQKTVGTGTDEQRNYKSCMKCEWNLGSLVHTISDVVGFALVGSTQLQYCESRMQYDYDKNKPMNRVLMHLNSYMLRTWIKILFDLYLSRACPSLLQALSFHSTGIMGDLTFFTSFILALPTWYWLYRINQIHNKWAEVKSTDCPDDIPRLKCRIKCNLWMANIFALVAAILMGFAFWVWLLDETHQSQRGIST